MEGKTEGHRVEASVSIEKNAISVGRGAVYSSGMQIDVAVDSEYNWQDEAGCLGVDPDLFFPEPGANTREAKEVCRGCVVREDCLEYALTNVEKFGIWGGLSERERRRLRRQRAQAASRITA